MQDIARIVGVSRPAVSAAFNPNSTTKISAKMRMKILQVAKELNYTPNVAARHLKGAATNLIGVYGVPYVSDIEQAFFIDFSCALNDYGYSLITSYGMTSESTQSAARELLAKGIDGMLITTVNHPLPPQEYGNVPTVFCPPCTLEDADISIDYAASTAAVAEIMIKRGCRRFGFVNPLHFGQEFFHTPNNQKFSGVQQTVAQHPECSLSFFAIHDYEGKGADIAQAIIDARVDVLFCCNDYFGGRMMAALTAKGVKFPDDMLLIGYDGTSHCDNYTVPMATIIQPMRQRAEMAAQLMLQRIEHKLYNAPPARITLTPYFYPSVSSGDKNYKLESMPVSNSYISLEACWQDIDRKFLRLDDK